MLLVIAYIGYTSSSIEIIKGKKDKVLELKTIRVSTYCVNSSKVYKVIYERIARRRMFSGQPTHERTDVFSTATDVCSATSTRVALVFHLIASGM